MSKMENFIAVQDKTEGIIGKFLYYSTSNILIKRDKFIEIGQSFGLPKFKPAKESKSGISQRDHCHQRPYSGERRRRDAGVPRLLPG